MAGELCVKCGLRLDQWLIEQKLEYHINCDPNGDFSPVGGPHHDFYAQRLKDDVTEIITWADRNSRRSLQKEVGASEVVTDCWRKLGYRMAGVPAANAPGDPWPAIVGTSIHHWLDDAVTRFSEAHGLTRWTTEQAVEPVPGMMSHTDLYDDTYKVVIDWKSKGTEDMRKIRKGEIPADHIEQVHLYAAGHLAAGREVERVALIFVPRAGWLTGFHVWSQPYDPAISAAAIDKYRRVQAGVAYYRVTEQPENWEKFPATPGRGCGWCPWHNPKLLSASAEGCPGK